MDRNGLNENVLRVFFSWSFYDFSNKSFNANKFVSAASSCGGAASENHRFSEYNFSSLQRCHLCDKFLYGLMRQGVQCRGAYFFPQLHPFSIMGMCGEDFSNLTLIWTIVGFHYIIKFIQYVKSAYIAPEKLLFSG